VRLNLGIRSWGTVEAQFGAQQIAAHSLRTVKGSVKLGIGQSTEKNSDSRRFDCLIFEAFFKDKILVLLGSRTPRTGVKQPAADLVQNQRMFSAKSG
jgi:hypothetical protein